MPREIIERFVGRYQIWRDEERAKRRGRETNPLTPFAVVSALVLGHEIYRAVTSHHIEARVLIGTAVVIAFLLLYIRRSPWAWLVVPVWGAMILSEAPTVFSLFPPEHYPLRVRLFSNCLFVAVGTGVTVSGFIIRRRYHSYLDYREEKRRSRDAGHPSI